MIACHGKLGKLFFYPKITQFVLLRKFVTEAQTIVKQTKTNKHLTVCSVLYQKDSKLVIMVTDLFFFSPNRLPSIIDSNCFDLFYREIIVQRRFRVSIFFAFYFSTEFHFFVLAEKFQA